MPEDTGNGRLAQRAGAGWRTHSLIAGHGTIDTIDPPGQKSTVWGKICIQVRLTAMENALAIVTRQVTVELDGHTTLPIRDAIRPLPCSLKQEERLLSQGPS